MKQILIISAFLYFGLTSKNLFACSCIGESNIKNAYENSNIVFVGQIINTEIEEWNGFYLTKVLVKSESVFKGLEAYDTLTIYTGAGGGDCGYNFLTGRKYIIYGNTEDSFQIFYRELFDNDFPNGQNIYWTNICTRTKEYNKEEIKQLDKIKK